MADLELIREAVRRHIQDDGVVIESALPDGVPLVGTVGNVVSLAPARVELLSGRVVTVRAYMGPVPNIDQTVLMVRINRWWVAFTGMTVV